MATQTVAHPNLLRTRREENFTYDIFLIKRTRVSYTYTHVYFDTSAKSGRFAKREENRERKSPDVA